MIEHPHAGEEARRIVEQGTVLLVQVGSGVHGTGITGQDDRDEMGLCLEPAAYVTGLRRVRTPTGQLVPFEQYELHTAWERSGGLAERSGAGDLDIVVYGARTWAALAAAGNPTVLLPLWVPDSEVVSITSAGRQLRENADRFVSRHVGERIAGYVTHQREAMLGARGARPAHIGQHGYDTKYAMHAMRLGIQGVELLTTGRMTLPVPEPHLSDLRAIRTDQWPVDHLLRRLDAVQDELEGAARRTSLPDEPDRDWIDAWLHDAYTAHWALGIGH